MILYAFIRAFGQLEFAKMAEVMLKGLQWLSWKNGSKTKGLQTRERSRSYWSGSVAAFEDLFSRGMPLGFCYVLFVCCGMLWGVLGMNDVWICLNREIQCLTLFGALKGFPHFPCPCATHGEGRNKFPAKSQPCARVERHGHRKSFLGKISISICIIYIYLFPLFPLFAFLTCTRLISFVQWMFSLAASPGLRSLDL